VVTIGTSGQPQALQDAWSAWEESGRAFWIEMDAVVEMLDGLVADGEGEAARG
jgi:type I restriction enzyme M protein